MRVDRREVERIAELARLRFDADEVERLTRELNGILAHVDALRTVEDAAREADDASHAQLAGTRADESGEPDPLGAGPSSIAPRWADGFFVVPAPPGVHDGGTGS